MAHHLNALETTAKASLPSYDVTNPRYPVLWQDGFNDDAPALNAILAGGRVEDQDGKAVHYATDSGDIEVPPGTYYVASPVFLPEDGRFRMDALLLGIGGYEATMV